MREHQTDTILLICGSELKSADILTTLFEAGINVVGPAPNAGLALVLAAQTAPTIAVIAGQPTGKRNAEQLATELMRIWGIPSWVLEAPQSNDEDCTWQAPRNRVAAIRGILATSETDVASC